MFEAEIKSAVLMLTDAFRSGNKLLVCGNGGSSADADHIVGELMKGFVLKRPLDVAFRKKAAKLYGAEGDRIASSLQQGLPAISLSCQTALMTAFINDCDAEMLFAQQVNALMKEGDVLLAISTSGKSKNVVAAARTAKIVGGKVIVLSGCGGGTLKELADLSIISPQTETYKIQQDHMQIYHAICLDIESELFANKE